MSDRIGSPTLGTCDVCEGPIVAGDTVTTNDGYFGQVLVCYVCGLQFLRTIRSPSDGITVTVVQSLDRLTNRAYRAVLWESHR